MKNKTLIIGVIFVAMLFWGVSSAQAATFNISSNIGGFTVTIWYGTTESNVQPTWYSQGVWTGNLTLSGMPDGWYTWNVESWPSGYHLVGIDGAAYQQGGNVSWNVNWEADAPPVPSVSISANPTLVSSGGTTAVSWSVSPSGDSRISCTGGGTDPNWSGQNLGNTGYTSTSQPLYSPQTYSVTCSSSSGSDTKEVAVNVQYTLSISKSGSGSGTVTGGNGINCGSSCSAVFNYGNMVGLDAAPAAGSVFSGWSGPCSGTGGCVFQINSNQTVTATFDLLPTYTLTVSKSGSGSGTVTGSGINCGSDCSESYQSGNCIEYSHSEDSDSTWGGWSGACTGSGCIICFDGDKSLTATFNEKQIEASITCSPGTIPYNSSANVSWSSANASNCTVSPTGWTGLSGSQSTGNLTSPQTYTITCTSD